MRLFAASVAVIALAVAALVGGLVHETSNASEAALTPAETAALASGYASGDTEALVGRLEAAARARPAESSPRALLGLALTQRARETGDAAFYTRAEAALRHALMLDPTSLEATLGLGSVALSRHRFREAFAFGRRAQRLAPDSAAPLGVIGDSLLELGRYREAFAAFDRMVELKPSVSSYARIAYARELRGNLPGAIEAMTLAVDAAGTGATEAGAFARTQLANLVLPRRPAAAARIYRQALLLRPAYAPALIGLAQAQESRGLLRRARDLYRRSLAAAPSPDAAVSLAGVLSRLGEQVDAERAYDRAYTMERDFARHGGRNELETAMLDLDRDGNLRDALRRARIGHAERPSIEGEHVLAWALYKNGRCVEARRHSIRHLRLGTPDSDGLYHRVLIERCLGNGDDAARFLKRLLRVDPTYLRSAPSAFRAGG